MEPTTKEARGALRYVVRNTSGGILGGYHELRHAEQCRAWFERVYERSGLVGDVRVRITEIGGRKW